MTKISFKRIAVKLIGYVKESWGSPFIVGFMVLLLAAAISLSLGTPSLPSNLADLSYYVLVAGILLELASFLRYRGKRNGEVSV